MAGISGTPGGGASIQYMQPPPLHMPKPPPQVQVSATEVLPPTEFAQRAASLALSTAQRSTLDVVI